MKEMMKTQPEEGLSKFWKEYDLTDEYQLFTVFKISLDLSGMVDDWKIRGEIRKEALALGWSRDRLREIETAAASWSNPAKTKLVVEKLEFEGKKVHKTNVWAL